MHICSGSTANFSSSIACILIGLIWSFGLLMPYPLFVYTYLFERSSLNSTISSTFSCRSFLSEKELLIYEVILYIVTFVIPFWIIVMFSLKILCQWLKYKETSTRSSLTKKKARVVKLCLHTLLSFLICYTPFWAFKFYTRFLFQDSIERYPLLSKFLSHAHLLVVLLIHVEDILNPLFFIILTKPFFLTLSKHRQRRSKSATEVISFV
jgi:glycerol-3-phosphate acyltransferase PlsY